VVVAAVVRAVGVPAAAVRAAAGAGAKAATRTDRPSQ
jgi:hypothetical protein